MLFIVFLRMHKQAVWGFVGDEHQHNLQGISYPLIDYIELLDWTAAEFALIFIKFTLHRIKGIN